MVLCMLIFNTVYAALLNVCAGYNMNIQYNMNI